MKSRRISHESTIVPERGSQSGEQSEWKRVRKRKARVGKNLKVVSKSWKWPECVRYRKGKARVRKAGEGKS